MPPARAPKVGYTVTGASPDVKIGFDGGPIEGTTYTYEATNGYTGKLFIPHPVDRDPQAVLAAIAGDLQAVVSVLGTSGTVGG